MRDDPHQRSLVLLVGLSMMNGPSGQANFVGNDPESPPPHTWYTVQAISLISMWPFPTSSLSTDTTPMLVNIAQTITMQLGLDQPEFIQDFSRTKRKLTSVDFPRQ